MPSTETQAQLVDQLIGSVLQAIVRAQGHMSSQFAEFIERVGFETDENGELQTRTFAFSFYRSQVDETTGEITQTRVTTRMPLLSIITLPALGIDEATVKLDLRLVAHKEVEAPSGSLHDNDSKIPTFSTLPKPLKLYGVTAPKRIVRGRDGPVVADSAGTMNVSIRLRAFDQPIGLDKLLSVLDGSHHEEEEQPQIPR